MTQDIAINAAERYAADWCVPWGAITNIAKRRSWWRFFVVADYEVAFESDYGTGVVIVACPDRVTRFEFFPNDEGHFMVPPWAAYPEYDAVTIGWRMGTGEVYANRWRDWYDGLSDELQSEYKRRFPPPSDETRGWYDFYELIANVRGESIVRR